MKGNEPQLPGYILTVHRLCVLPAPFVLQETNWIDDPQVINDQSMQVKHCWRHPRHKKRLIPFLSRGEANEPNKHSAPATQLQSSCLLCATVKIHRSKRTPLAASKGLSPSSHRSYFPMCLLSSCHCRSTLMCRSAECHFNRQQTRTNHRVCVCAQVRLLCNHFPHYTRPDSAILFITNLLKRKKYIYGNPYYYSSFLSKQPNIASMFYNTSKERRTAIKIESPLA